MCFPVTLRLGLTLLVAAGLAACSKEPVPLPAATASYKLDGQLITCKVVVYPLTPVYNGEQLLVRLFPPSGSGSGIGSEYLDLSFVKQPTEPSSAYKTNWVRYNGAGIPSGAMLLKDAVLTITETSAGSFSGTATGTALYANSTFSSITEAVFTNAHL
ncbi:MAG: hypothetical protein ACRYFK_16590 [Janthinobacterium lividum]